MNATETVTLSEFLARFAVCRVWYTSFGSPTGAEYIANTDDDAGEDYCDSETLLGLRPVAGALETDATGTVSTDDDGETRWECDDTGALRDVNGNTVFRLVVWGE
jgi:hypothetical protein